MRLGNEGQRCGPDETYQCPQLLLYLPLPSLGWQGVGAAPIQGPSSPHGCKSSQGGGHCKVRSAPTQGGEGQCRAPSLSGTRSTGQKP